MATQVDTYCGIYCGACSIRTYGATGQADGFVACCRGVPTAELTCHGCKSTTVYAGCRMCTFRDCATAKGVATCGHCAEYPCQHYRTWQSASRLLPHVGEAAANLDAIKRLGVEAWSADQKQRWSCPDCGTSFSWYTQACAQCGRDLTGKSYRMAGLRKLVCRFVLPRVYRKGTSRATSTAQGRP